MSSTTQPHARHQLRAQEDLESAYLAGGLSLGAPRPNIETAYLRTRLAWAYQRIENLECELQEGGAEIARLTTGRNLDGTVLAKHAGWSWFSQVDRRTIDILEHKAGGGIDEVYREIAATWDDADLNALLASWGVE